MAWPINPRPANSLVKLRDQINTAHPNRSKASDGMIGDVAHAADPTSDHNPNAAGVICAFDITHDPANGVDIDKLSDALANSHDPRIKYLIANNLICVPDDYGDWGWYPYSGVDPHTNHLHVSVYKDYDNTSAWNIGEYVMDREDAINSYQSTFHRYPSEKEIQGRIGKKYSEMAISERTSKEWKDIDEAVTLYPGMIKAKETLLNQVETLKKASSQAPPKQLTPGIYEVKG